MTYQDRWTRWHHKPVRNGEPSSNNGWIYSAYSRYILPDTLDEIKLTECMMDCTVSFSEFKYNRSPSQITPPFSRDEAMGVLSVIKSKMMYSQLKKNHWNFCNFLGYKKKPLTLGRLYSAVKTLYKLKDAHRNFFWLSKMEETYSLAFRLPPQDISYLKMMYGEAGLFDKLLIFADIWNTAKRGDKSNKMIIWLKMKDLGWDGSWIWNRYVKEKEWITNYFGAEHPFAKEINK